MDAARPPLVRAVHGVRGTQDLARELAAAFGPRAFYALEGDLGAGKTCFVQGLCARRAPCEYIGKDHPNEAAES